MPELKLQANLSSYTQDPNTWVMKANMLNGKSISKTAKTSRSMNKMILVVTNRTMSLENIPNSLAHIGTETILEWLVIHRTMKSLEKRSGSGGFLHRA